MKTFLFPIIALFVGTALGVGNTVYEFSSQPSRFEVGGYNVQGDYAPLKPVTDDGKAKVVVVNGETHNFGEMDVNKKYEHSFILKNKGDAPMSVEILATSCKCTVADLPNGDVPPGGTVEVTLAWTPKQTNGDFSHSAQIGTSDKERSVIVLRVKGTVKTPFTIDPFDFYFGDLSSNETKTVQIRVLSYETENLEYRGFKFTHAKTENSFDAKIEMLDEETLKKENALSGMNVSVTVTPGLKKGHIVQSLQIDTNIQDDGGLVIPITGKIVGDVLFLGHRKLDRKISLLSLDVIKRGKSVKETIYLSVRGPHRDMAELKVIQEEITPSNVIQASFGEPKQSGKTKLFPLHITIPADSAAANLYGPDKDSYGKIPIRTSLPTEEVTTLYVKVIVER